MVVASDLLDYGGLDFVQDFFKTVLPPSGCRTITTNPRHTGTPPTSRAMRSTWCQTSNLLLRLAFLESVGRTDILEQRGLRVVHVFRNRLPMMHRDGWSGPRASSSVAFAWFCWRRDHCGPAIINRISWAAP